MKIISITTSKDYSYGFNKVAFEASYKEEDIPKNFNLIDYELALVPSKVIHLNTPAEEALQNSISLLLIHVRAKINTSITCEENILGNSRVNPFVIKKLQSEGFTIIKLDDSRFVVKW